MSTLSVAMPNYNHARYLPRAIEGIVNQTRAPDEFLILDDASTDNSLDIIQSYAKKHPFIRVVKSERNLGVIAAHETLYRQAQGEYLYSAAADDDRFPTFFELAMRLAERHPQAGLVFGKMLIVDESGREVGETEARSWHEPLYASPERFLHEFLDREPPMQAMTGATIFRRSVFEEVGWCRAELGSFADTFAARAVALKHGACYVPEPFYIWHRMGGSFSDKTNRSVERGLDIIARAERLMHSSEFSDRFPCDYVRRWARRQKWQTIYSFVLGAEDASQPRSPFWKRNLRRLPRIPRAAAMLFYKGEAGTARNP